MATFEPTDAQLRSTVEQLRAENARLREQLSAAGMAVGVGSAPGAQVDKATAVNRSDVSRRRRWVGRVVAAALLVLGFGAGLLVASREGTPTNRAFRAGYEDGAAAARARQNAPVAPVRPSPSPTPPTTPPTTPPAGAETP
jgi:hypothetical protein